VGASRQAVPSLVLAAARAGSKRLRVVWFILADVVSACVDDLQRVIDLRPA
jgi:hypothetical protein